MLLNYVLLEGKFWLVCTMAALLIHLALLPSMASRMHQYRWSTCLLSVVGLNQSLWSTVVQQNTVNHCIL